MSHTDLQAFRIPMTTPMTSTLATSILMFSVPMFM